MDRKDRLPTIEEFGAKLLETGDLDPLYIALHRAPSLQTDGALLARWLFAYWCCYHAGASSFIAEATGDGYWIRLAAMASNHAPSPTGERWPRGHERRHFRGEKAVMAVESYRTRFLRPELPVEWFGSGLYPADNANRVPLPYKTVRDRVMTLPQFGPWIAFKVADMLERVAGVPVSFSDADVLMFDQPYKSALQVYTNWYEESPPRTLALGPGGNVFTVSTLPPESRVKLVSETLQHHFRGTLAPPSNDRPVNVQEVETILCKWKSHNTGHYPVGIDSHELRAGLQTWAGVSHVAHELYHFAPGGNL